MSSIRLRALSRSWASTGISWVLGVEILWLCLLSFWEMGRVW